MALFETSSWFKYLPPEGGANIYEKHLRMFFGTMYERQQIWKRRFLDKKDRPWTDDPILRYYKFTNVYRELDRSSQWQIHNILLDDSLSLKNLVWKLMVFRFFNNPDTFTFNSRNKEFKPLKEVDKELTYPKSRKDFILASKWRNGIPDYDEYDEDEFSRFILGVRAAGQNPYTNAYFINSKAVVGKSRDYCYTKLVIPTLHERIGDLIKTVLKAKRPEDIIDFLNTLPAVSNFISHEFYQDFSYISRYTNRKFMKFDQDDYTTVGPGCSIGIRLIYPNLHSVRDQKQAIYDLRDMSSEVLKDIAKERGETMPFLHWDKERRDYYVSDECNITLHQIEMWLCEFQKYWKMQIGSGKQRFAFKPKKTMVSK